MRRHGSAAALWLRADGCVQVLYLPTRAIERVNVVRLQKETKRKKKSPASSVSAAAARGSCGNEGCCHAAQAKYPSQRQLSQSLSCLWLDGLDGRGGRQTDTRRQRTVKIDAARHQEKANTAEAGTRKTGSDAVSLSCPSGPQLCLSLVWKGDGWMERGLEDLWKHTARGRRKRKEPPAHPWMPVSTSTSRSLRVQHVPATTAARAGPQDCLPHQSISRRQPRRSS